MTTPAEQAAEALRRARSKLGNAGQDVDYVDEALAALTAEAGRPYEWAMSRWKAEVANRPLQNIHRRSLDTTWRQVIRHYGGDDIALCGPPHGELIDDAESARVSPDREALARRLDALQRNLDALGWGNTLPAEAAAALRLPAQAEVEAKDAAYHERNQVVAALAKLFPSGITRTDIPGWEPEWHGCVFIDLPTGQVSWHYHDREADLFADLPAYMMPWDGHDTPEKYRRLARLSSPSPAVGEWRPAHVMIGPPPHRMVAAFDAKGQQVGEWQGPLADVLHRLAPTIGRVEIVGERTYTPAPPQETKPT